MKPRVGVRIALLLFHYFMSSPSSALQERCAKNMNQFPNSVKEISNLFPRAARPVSTGNFFRVFCPPLADYGRFPYVSSFHIRGATHLHVGEYACRTRSRRAEVRERVYLFVNDQAWNIAKEIFI